LIGDPVTEQREQIGDETERLRRCMSDMLSLLSLPVVWAGGDVAQISRVLLAVLPAMLDVDFVCLKLIVGRDSTPQVSAWVSDHMEGVEAADIDATLNQSFGQSMSAWPKTAMMEIGDHMLSVAQTRFGINGHTGVLVAGSGRSGFPVEAEQLLLNVAGNQLAIAVNEAYSLVEQKRLAAELDERVAQRTEELASTIRALAEEVAERKTSEERLRRGEMLLAAGERISLTGTFSWRIDTDEQLFSDQLKRIFGFNGDAPVTFDEIARHVHPEDRSLLAEKIAEVRRGGASPDYEIRLLDEGGVVKFLRVLGQIIRHGDGRVECIGAVQDITRRRRAEQARDAVRSELSHVTRVMSLGALTTSMAHEVNQPLSGIITNAGTCLKMLASDPPNVAVAIETARRTIRDGNRAAEVIARLRALFRRKTSIIEPIDLNEAAEEVVGLLWSDLQKARVRLTLELADDLPRVAGDRVQLQQVIMNLMRNAMDATEEVEDRPRHLLVRTTSDGKQNVRMSVRDTGVGFDSPDPETLFNAFYSTKHEGMGIGLSVSRSIVESHEGRIWARANEGPGTTVEFWLPQDLAASADISRDQLSKAESS
jgi:PAS domain S-box-containing protein